MKKCPFCAEEIQDEAIKCKHCGEMLNAAQKTGWFFRPSIFVVSLLCVGPLALPLLWFNPKPSRNVKIAVTVVVMVLTYFLTVSFVHGVQSLQKYYKELSNELSNV